jgi:hypothetical protein
MPEILNWADGPAIICMWEQGWEEIKREAVELGTPTERILITLRKEDQVTLRSVKPRPRPDPRDTIRDWISRNPEEIERLRAGERTNAAYTHAGQCGPFRNRTQCGPKGIEVGHYSSASWRSECLWHQYWMGSNTKLREYTSGRASLIPRHNDEEIVARQPPHPTSYDRTTFYSWRQILAIADQAAHGEQLELFA